MFFDGVSKGIHKSLETVVNPLKEAKNGVSKKVLGPKLDLLEHAEETFAIQEFSVFYKKELTELVARLKKEKVASPKLAILKKMCSYAPTEDSFDEFVSGLFSHIAHIKHVCKEGYQVTALENTLPKVIKSKKWTKAEKVPVVVGIEEMEMNLHTAKNDISGSLPGFLLRSLPTEESLKQSFTQAKKQLDLLHDDALSLHMNLNRSLKKYNKVVDTLKRERKNLEQLEIRTKKALPTERKDYTKKITVAKKTLKTLSDTTLPVLEKDIAENTEATQKNTEQEMKVFSMFADEYAAYQKKSFLRVATNKKQTTMLEKKKNPSVSGKDTTYRGVELLLKAPYAQAQKFITASKKAIDHHNSYMHSYNNTVTRTIAELTHKEKDIMAKEYCIKDHQTFLHNQAVLHKMGTLFMTFTNRYTKQHSTLAKKAIASLTELERSNKKHYAPHTSALKKALSVYESTLALEKKRSEALKKSITSNRKHMRDLARLIVLLGHDKHILHATKATTTYPSYITLLQTTTKLLQKHTKTLAGHKGKIEKNVAMTGVELADKELSLSATSAARTKKAYESLHATHQQQELFYELFERYTEEQTHLLEDSKELASSYAKSLKKAKKTKGRYETLRKTTLKKLKNSPMVAMFYSL